MVCLVVVCRALLPCSVVPHSFRIAVAPGHAHLLQTLLMCTILQSVQSQQAVLSPCRALRCWDPSVSLAAGLAPHAIACTRLCMLLAGPVSQPLVHNAHCAQLPSQEDFYFSLNAAQAAHGQHICVHTMYIFLRA